MEIKKKVAIIGAGPAGLAAAIELMKSSSFEITIYEASEAPGGMCRSLELWGQTVDLGPHRFFTKAPMVEQLWLQGAVKVVKVSRLTRIFFNQKFFQYPLEIKSLFKMMGFVEAIKIGCSYLKARLSPYADMGDFESWIKNKFGNRLYKKFFKSYSEKLWGLACHELDSEFARQRIKKLDLLEALKGLFLWRKNAHRTLIDEFLYPINGTGSVYQELALQLVDQGHRIFYKNPVRGIKYDCQKWVIKDQHGLHEYDEVISSMPLTHLIQALTAPLEIIKVIEKLKFRNTILVYLQIDKTNLFPDQWIYVQDSGYQTGRITNFSNWASTDTEATTILCLEYWCSDEEALWTTPDHELSALAQKELTQTGLLQDGKILASKVIRLPRSYPVYFLNYRQELLPVIDYLSQQKNLQVIGRYGSYKYNNQDHSILMGILAAQNLTSKTKINLWEVNSDDEYQEIQKAPA